MVDGDRDRSETEHVGASRAGPTDTPPRSSEGADRSTESVHAGGPGVVGPEWTLAADRTRNADEGLTVAIAAALANARDVSVLDLQAPLYDYVDVETLERIVEADSPSTRAAESTCVAFDYVDNRVVVEGDGNVLVYERAG